MQFENPLTFVRSIKGAPASILLAFMFSRKTMTAKELIRWTGYKDDNITDGLQLLVETGWLLARSARGPWCLADGRQMPLTDSDLIGISDVVVERESNLPTITTTTTLTRTASPIKSDSQNRRSANQAEEVTDEYNLNIETLASFQIYGKKARQVAGLEWATPDYIRAHVEDARGKTWLDNPDGFALTQMIEQVPAPGETETIKRNSADDMVITSGRGKNASTLIVPADLVQEVAAFTGHAPKCRCLDCTIGRTQGVSRLCPDCKHYRCECEESEEP